MKKIFFLLQRENYFFIFTRQLRNDATIEYQTGSACFAIRYLVGWVEVDADTDLTVGSGRPSSFPKSKDLILEKLNVFCPLQKLRKTGASS